MHSSYTPRYKPRHLGVPNPTPASLKPPIHNPYDKFTQPEFDDWIGGITSALRKALGEEDLDANVKSPLHAFDDYVDGGVDDSFADLKARRDKVRGKMREVDDGDEIPLKGLGGSPGNAIELSDDEELVLPEDDDDADESSVRDLIRSPSPDSDHGDSTSLLPHELTKSTQDQPPEESLTPEFAPFDQQSPDIQDPWDAALEYAEDLYTGGDVSHSRPLSPSHLAEDDIQHVPRTNGLIEHPFEISDKEEEEEDFGVRPFTSIEKGKARAVSEDEDGDLYAQEEEEYVEEGEEYVAGGEDDESDEFDEDREAAPEPDTPAIRERISAYSFPTPLRQPSPTFALNDHVNWTNAARDELEDYGGDETGSDSNEETERVDSPEVFSISDEDEEDDDHDRRSPIPLGTSDLDIPDHDHAQDGDDELDEYDEEEDEPLYGRRRTAMRDELINLVDEESEDERQPVMVAPEMSDAPTVEELPYVGAQLQEFEAPTSFVYDSQSLEFPVPGVPTFSTPATLELQDTSSMPIPPTDQFASQMGSPDPVAQFFNSMDDSAVVNVDSIMEALQQGEDEDLFTIPQMDDAEAVEAVSDFVAQVEDEVAPMENFLDEAMAVEETEAAVVQEEQPAVVNEGDITTSTYDQPTVEELDYLVSEPTSPQSDPDHIAAEVISDHAQEIEPFEYTVEEPITEGRRTEEPESTFKPDEIAEPVLKPEETQDGSLPISPIAFAEPTTPIRTKPASLPAVEKHEHLQTLVASSPKPPIANPNVRDPMSPAISISSPPDTPVSATEVGASAALSKFIRDNRLSNEGTAASSSGLFTPMEGESPSVAPSSTAGDDVEAGVEAEAGTGLPKTLDEVPDRVVEEISNLDVDVPEGVVAEKREAEVPSILDLESEGLPSNDVEADIVDEDPMAPSLREEPEVKPELDITSVDRDSITSMRTAPMPSEQDLAELQEQSRALDTPVEHPLELPAPFKDSSEVFFAETLATPMECSPEVVVTEQSQGLVTPLEESQELASPIEQPQELTAPVEQPQGLVTPLEESHELAIPVEKSQELVTPFEQSQALDAPVEQPHGLVTPLEQSQELAAPVEQSQELAAPVEQSQELAAPVEQPQGLVSPLEESHELAVPAEKFQELAAPFEQSRELTKPAEQSQQVASPVERLPKPETPSPRTREASLEWHPATLESLKFKPLQLQLHDSSTGETPMAKPHASPVLDDLKPETPQPSEGIEALGGADDLADLELGYPSSTASSPLEEDGANSVHDDEADADGIPDPDFEDVFQSKPSQLDNTSPRTSASVAKAKVQAKNEEDPFKLMGNDSVVAPGPVTPDESEASTPAVEDAKETKPTQKLVKEAVTAPSPSTTKLTIKFKNQRPSSSSSVVQKAERDEKPLKRKRSPSVQGSTALIRSVTEGKLRTYGRKSIDKGPSETATSSEATKEPSTLLPSFTISQQTSVAATAVLSLPPTALPDGEFPMLHGHGKFRKAAQAAQLAKQLQEQATKAAAKAAAAAAAKLKAAETMPSTEKKLTLKIPPMPRQLSDQSHKHTVPTSSSLGLNLDSPSSPLSSTSSLDFTSASQPAPVKAISRAATPQPASASVSQPSSIPRSSKKTHPQVGRADRSTRSNCRYRKMSIPADEDGPRITFCVPQCSLNNKELMEEEEATEDGPATQRDYDNLFEHIETLDFLPYLQNILRLLCGPELIQENEIYYLPKEGEVVMRRTPEGTLRRATRTSYEKTYSHSGVTESPKARTNGGAGVPTSASTVSAKSVLRKGGSTISDLGSEDEGHVPPKKRRKKNRVGPSRSVVFKNGEDREGRGAASGASSSNATPQKARKSQKALRKGKSLGYEYIEESEDEGSETGNRKSANRTGLKRSRTDGDERSSPMKEGQSIISVGERVKRLKRARTVGRSP